MSFANSTNSHNPSPGIPSKVGPVSGCGGPSCPRLFNSSSKNTLMIIKIPMQRSKRRFAFIFSVLNRKVGTKISVLRLKNLIFS